MHFYCPHPLFLHSSSLLSPAATTSLSSSAALPLAWHPHPSSALCTSILFHSNFLAASSFSFFDRPTRPSVHRALNCPISIGDHFIHFFAPYLTRKQTQAAGDKCGCEEKQLFLSLSVPVTSIILHSDHKYSVVTQFSWPTVLLHLEDINSSNQPQRDLTLPVSLSYCACQAWTHG